MNLAYAFARMGLRYGRRTAIVAEDGRTIPYDDFARRILRVGSALTQLGLGDGARVALCLPDSPEELEVDYGILASPYMRVQLDPRGRLEDVAACARDAEAEAIIFHASVAPLVDEATTGLDLRRIAVGGPAHEALDYEDWLRRDGDATIPDRDEAGLKSIQYSSGTTSKPKGILLTERNLLALLGNLMSGRPVLPDDVFLHVRTLHLGSATVIVQQFLGGGKVVLGGRFKPDTFPDLVARHKATSSSLVPTHLVRQLDADFERAAFDTMRVITLGGAPAAPDTFETALERIGNRFGVVYGLTEAAWHTHLNPADLETPPERRRQLIRSVGREMFGYEVAIVDDGGQPLPRGEIGEVALRGDNLMAGYWRQPELTAQTIQNGWLMTTDLGRQDEEGYLYITGRKTLTINTGAYKVQPVEVENALLAHEDVLEAVVFGVPDREFGETVKALVVRRPGSQVEEVELMDFCRDRLTGWKKPRILEFVSELPRNEHGKVMRPKLQGAD